MAKKRTSAAAGIRAEDEGRSTKKRKAAEVSRAKTREMTDVDAEYERDFDEELVRNSRSRSKKGGKPKQERVEAMPLFAPGLRLFEGFSDTIRNTEIAALTKPEPDMEESRKYGFTLKPLIVTEGPLAGETILVLQKTATFRFLDLPPEIRNIIYGFLIDHPKENAITSYKPVGKERRPVPSTFSSGRYVTRRGRTWDKENGKCSGGPHSSHSLLRVCKQVQEETGTLLYSATTFTFWTWSDMKLFLDNIGSMRRFLRDIQLPDGHKGFSKSRSVFKKLQDAIDLQSLTISHSDVCANTRYRGRGWYGVDGFVHLIQPVFSALQKRGTDSKDLLDIIQVKNPWASDSMCPHCEDDTQACYACRMGRVHEKGCLRTGSCNVNCKDKKTHVEELQGEVRAALAEALGIEDA